MRADRKEILRYLGYGKNCPEPKAAELIEETAQELEQASQLRSVYREYECSIEGSQVTIGTLGVHSTHLAKNLAGCERAVVLAATIGRSADLMIKKYSVTNMAKAAVVQAAGAACIESCVDEIEAQIRREAEQRGFYLRPRFSPGYGDFSLEHQKDIFDMLECNKRIGLTLTEGNLMMPSKSVTAVIGLTRQKQSSCHAADCSRCEKIDCEFRRDGKEA